MAKRWLIYSRGVNADDFSQYVKFKEIRTDKPDQPYDPNLINDGADNSNDFTVAVELEPPPIDRVVKLGEHGINYSLESARSLGFNTISDLFENFWEKLPQLHKKEKVEPDICPHCGKEKWNEIVNGRCKNWAEGVNTIQLHKNAGRWYLEVHTNKHDERMRLMLESEFEVTHCPWCGRELN